MSARVLLITTGDSADATLRDAIVRAWPDAAIETLSPTDPDFDLSASSWDAIIATQADLEQVVAEARARALHDASRASDDFLSVLLHEIRTPLTPILAWGQLLARSNDAARVAQGADVIERNVRIQMAILDDVLDLSRLARGTLRLDLRRHDLRDVARAALAAVQESADEKGIRLDRPDASAAPIALDIDLRRMEQAITYLLANAVRFTPSEGVVTLTLRAEPGGAAIIVHDTGLVFGDDGLPSTSALFRGEELGGRMHGTAGMQLALARGLVELHGGTLEVASPGEGTQFTLRLTASPGAR